MSMTQQVLFYLGEHRGQRFDNKMLRSALDTDDAQQISVALNALNNAGDIRRARKKSGAGFEYWVGDAPSGPSVPMSPAPPDVSKAGKRKYTRRTVAKKTALVRSPVATISEVVGPGVQFGILNDGTLGIKSLDQAVSLPRADVQRLQAFLTTVSALWT